MALDRECKDMPYLTGRLIAITEHYASKRFGPGTIGEMFKFPKRYIDVFWRYVDHDDAYLTEIGVAPMERMNNQEQSQAWVGYYHQKAEYSDTTHGGYRLGGGRPTTDRKCSLNVRISQEAADKLDKVANKSEVVDRLIREADI